jgi:ribulose-phosphate 3-epimerase
MTMEEILIAPSILACDFGRLSEEIQAVTDAGADWIHIDVMDGHFVPNITIGPRIVEAARDATQLPLDVHLMIEQPERYIESFVKSGATIVGVHAEACPHLHRTVAQIREAGARASVTINPGTPASAVEPVLGDVDQVLVMTVNPGFGGQRFIPGTLAKVETLRGWIRDRGLAVALAPRSSARPTTARPSPTFDRPPQVRYSSGFRQHLKSRALGGPRVRESAY